MATQAPQVQMMTPEEAGHILATCRFDRQRKIRAPWVSELAEIIAAGSWQTTAVTICECTEDNKSYLVDGYHRLSAILQSGIPAPVLVFRQPVDTLHNVGVIYSRLDRGMPRNVIDGLSARNLPAETDLSATVLRSGVAAVNVIRSGFKHDGALSNKRGYDEKFKEVMVWVPELRAYTDSVAGGNRMTSRRLYAAAILSVGLMVFKHQPEKAHDFFHSIATSTNIAEGSGKQAFINKLLDEESTARKLGTSKMCRYTAACWNAHYDDKQISKIQVYDTSKAIVLLGTPFTRWQNTKLEVNT